MSTTANEVASQPTAPLLVSTSQLPRLFVTTHAFESNTHKQRRAASPQEYPSVGGLLLVFLLVAYCPTIATNERLISVCALLTLLFMYCHHRRFVSPASKQDYGASESDEEGNLPYRPPW